MTDKAKLVALLNNWLTRQIKDVGIRVYGGEIDFLISLVECLY